MGQRFTDEEQKELEHAAEREAIREGKALTDKWEEIDESWISRVLGRHD